eukprot:scaffold4494_cov161-Amphora_coffeaeformis.AAC.8
MIHIRAIMRRLLIVFLLWLAKYLPVGGAMVFSQRWKESVATSKNLLEPVTGFTIIPRPVESQTNDKDLQDSTVSLCGSILQTIFAGNDASLDMCTCQVNTNNQLEYILTCDYSNKCGTICSDAVGSYDCFDRMDTYTVQVTDKFFVNAKYRGCGTYVNEGTTVCLTENRDNEGELSDRCLEIDGLSCQCHEAPCGEYVFQCSHHPQNSSSLEAFVLDECDEMKSYGHIEAGRVEGLLSSNVFSLIDCFDGRTRPPESPTVPPTLFPSRLPTSAIIRQQQPGMIQTSTSISNPTHEPATIPTVRSTITPSTRPTGATTKTLSGGPMSTPTNSPTLKPTTLEPTTAPTSSQLSLVPSINPTIFTSVHPTVALSTDTPTRTHIPTIQTMDLDLEPFALVFAREENHTARYPTSMVRAVQQLIVNELRHPSTATFSGHHNFATSMHDFRLQCGWEDADDIFGKSNETRLDCTGYATFRAKDAPRPITAAALANAQTTILLQDVHRLSDLLSGRLGESVQVIQVDMDLSIQSRDEYDKADGPSLQGASSTGTVCSVALATPAVVGTLFLFHFI